MATESQDLPEMTSVHGVTQNVLQNHNVRLQLLYISKHFFASSSSKDLKNVPVGSWKYYTLTQTSNW